MTRKGDIILDNWVIEGGVAYLEGKHGRVLVDMEDLPRLATYHVTTWSSGHHKACGIAYAFVARGIRLHRFILNAPQGVGVDHINGNGLDNRKCNLRICDQTQNQGNQKTTRGRKTKGTSVYRGVYRHSSGRWIAQVQFKGKKYSGSYRTELEAKAGYERMAKEKFGEFYRSDSPDGLPEEVVPLHRISASGERCIYYRGGFYIFSKKCRQVGKYATLAEAVAARDIYESAKE